ncbi:MAG: hypothetical protein NTW87_11390 [Planctomycetota bacterium]|nr:hypothetical protein [Planctomycetota bacterium]
MKALTTVQYHPEFLYFNDFVRRGGYNPTANAEIWRSPGGGSSPFDVFDYVLENVVLKKGGRPIAPLVRALLTHMRLPQACLRTDVQPWLAFAYSIGFEKLVSQHSATIFRLLATNFELPRLKVSPVRLRPLCNPDLFDKLYRGAYDWVHILRADPACYHAQGDWIFMPLPETRRPVPLALYDELVIHEILHAPLRAMHSFGVVCDEFIGFTSTRHRWQSHVFGELFANLGSVAVLYHERDLGRRKMEDLVHRVWTTRAVGSCVAAERAVESMLAIPFLQWGAIFRPVFGIYRRAAFLLEEQRRVSSATSKTLRGILRKKYGCGDFVRGMGNEQVRKQVSQRSSARLSALLRQVEELDLLRLLERALATETGEPQKRALQQLLDLFSEESRPKWKPMLDRA